MGKGQRRRLKRALEAGEEYEAARIKAEERKEMEDLPDQDLFLIDKVDRTSKTKANRAEKKARLFGPQHAHSLNTPSLYEAKKIDKLAKRLEKEGGSQALTTTSTKGRAVKEVYDIWGAGGEEEEEAGGGGADNNNKKKKRDKKRGVYKPLAPTDVPLSKPEHPGQSYNPTLDDHQQLLKKALDVEEARQAAIDQAKKPVGTHLSETTLAVMVGSSDEEEEDSEGEEEQGGLDMSKRKTKGKLTKTERNRQRRRKALEHAEKQRKAQKALLKQVEAASQEAAKRKREQGKSKDSQPSHSVVLKPREAKPVVLPEEVDPIKAKSVDVLLSEEVSGGLRQVKTQGDLAKESFNALKKRGWIEKGPGKKTSAKNRPSRRVKYMDKYRD